MRKLTNCPICSHQNFIPQPGYDYKPGPEVYAFLGMPGCTSQWCICKNCGFLFQNPRPTAELISSLYQSGLYRQKKVYNEQFFRSRYEKPLRHLAWFERHVGRLPGKRILDIGAGYGGAVKAFSDKGFLVKGIELDPSLCVKADEKYGVELINSDISACNFPPESFDIIYSSHVHEHFDDFNEVNKKIFSWLAPGGYFLCVVPTYRYSAKNGQGFINVFHNSIFTKTSLKNMFLKCGLQPIATSYPFRYGSAEVWGIGQKPLGQHEHLIPNNKDNGRLVSLEISFSPYIFNTIYKLIWSLASFRRLFR